MLVDRTVSAFAAIVHACRNDGSPLDDQQREIIQDQLALLCADSRIGVFNYDEYHSKCNRATQYADGEEELERQRMLRR